MHHLVPSHLSYLLVDKEGFQVTRLQLFMYDTLYLSGKLVYFGCISGIFHPADHEIVYKIQAVAAPLRPYILLEKTMALVYSLMVFYYGIQELHFTVHHDNVCTTVSQAYKPQTLRPRSKHSGQQSWHQISYC